MKRILILIFTLVAIVSIAATPQFIGEQVARFVSSSQMHLDNNNIKASESMAREAVKLSEQTNDGYLLAKSYGALGISLFKAEKSLGAEKYLSKSLQLYYALPEIPSEAITVISALNKLYEAKGIDFEDNLQPSEEVKGLEEFINKSQLFRLTSNNKSDGLKMAEKALSWAKNFKNKPLEARAEGSLGICLAQSENKKDIKQAVQHLENALTIFYQNQIKSPEISPIEQTLEELYDKYKYLNKANPPSDLFAGIEVGSKGVKMSIIKLKSDLRGEYSYQILADTAINTEIILFTAQSIKETIRAVKTLFSIAEQKHGISSKRIFTAISSGVESQARKNNKLPILVEIQDGVRAELNDPKRSVEVITTEEEPKLTHLGVVHKDGRYDAMIIDIGSGNTKGGYFADGSLNFISFNVDWGTKSLTNELEKKDFTSINDYARAVSDRVQRIKIEEIRPAVSAKSGLRNKPRIIMSGGICWAVATITHPESINSAYVEVSLEDVKKFKEMAIGQYEQLINKESQMYRIQNTVDREKAKKEIGRVLDAFDQKAMIAGASLLDTMMIEFNATSVQKKYYLARYGYIGWVTGYIIKSLAGDE